MSTPNRALAIVPDDREVTAYMARLQPKFNKDCTPAQLRQIAEVALQYELDPLMEELILYRGKLYVTFYGRVRIADRHPAYDSYEHGPCSEAEERALRPGPGEVVWKAAVYRKDRSRPIVAYGRAGGPNEENPVARKDPVSQAQERAIHRALRATFPLSLPGVEVEVSGGQIRAIHALDDDLGVDRQARREVLEATYGVSTSNELTAEQASAYLDTRTVDAETGEITDHVPGWDDEEEETAAAVPTAPPPPRNATEFWVRCRQIGVASRKALEETLGHEIATTSGTDWAALWDEVGAAVLAAGEES